MGGLAKVNSPAVECSTRSSMQPSNGLCEIEAEQIDVLACPSCHGEINPSLQCARCARVFTVAGNVIQMLPDVPQGGGWWGTDLPPIPILDLGKKGQPGYHQHRFGTTLAGRRKNWRERAIVNAFLGKLPKGAWVVDVPCGMGRFSDLALSRGLRLCGIDLNFDHVAHACAQTVGTHALWIQGDIAALPLRPRSMAAALCIRVSYYFDDEALVRVLTEIGRVAGNVLLSFRDAGSLVARWKAVRGRSSRSPLKHRTVSQIRDIARQAGFRVENRSDRSIALQHMQFLHLQNDDACNAAG